MRRFLLVLWLLGAVAAGAGPAVRRSAAADRPRLVAVVSVDQFAQEYMIRFADNFARDGLFRRAAGEGAAYRECNHRHAFTYTGPGHSVLCTGTYPNLSGIIANDWFDRGRQKPRYCVDDAEVKVIGAADGKPMSPRSLLVNTVGDQLKLATVGKARVFGVAIKDRAAILMAGHAADAAFWMDHDCWVTTDYYRPDLPAYLRDLNTGQALDRQYRGQVWDLLLPKAAYHNAGPDDNAWEKPPAGFTAAFPHALLRAGEGTAKEFIEQVHYSPFGNDYTLQAAREIVRSEGLGKRDLPDLLCVSLSSNDYVGHAFGPHSLEVEDLAYRTDLQLGAFARFLDQQVGAGRWTLILTADHGIAPIVGYAQRLRIPAIHDPLPAKRMETELEAELRRELNVSADSPPLISAVEEYQLYLNHAHPALAGGRLPLARRIARDWVAAQPHVAIARSAEELQFAGGNELHQALRRSFHPQRSGDVLWSLAPYCLPGDKKHPDDARGTTHGSPWHYDTHVPLLLLGADIRPGVFDRPVSPAAIAPTVARLLHVDAPGASVELPLGECLAE